MRSADRCSGFRPACMTAASGSPSETTPEGASGIVRGGGASAAQRTCGSARFVLRRRAAVRARINRLLGGHDAERHRVGTLPARIACCGPALLLDDLWADR